MTQKTILITGCSSGIGLAAAQSLQAKGWRVFAACRTLDDCTRLIALGFESPQIDYEDPASITAGLTEVLKATGGTLDALYNNGAYAIPGAVEDISRDALRTIFEANLFGWHDLTVQVLPIMRAQGHGKIINCSSVLGLVPAPWRGAYTATKFALEGLTDTLRLEMRDTPIDIILLDPGPITSAFRSNSAKQFELWINWQESPRAALYRESLRKRLYDAAETKAPFELPATAVVRKLNQALTARKPRARYYVTTPTYAMALLRRILPTSWLDWLLAKG